MSRRAVTILETLIGAVILAVVIGVVMVGVNLMGRQSRQAYATLAQTQDALLLLESIRLELASIVMNPFARASQHEGNSFIISQPNGTSIQFVTERKVGTGRERFLVYYEAANPEKRRGESTLALRKTVWAFKQQAPWNQRVTFPPGWPAGWVGAVTERQEDRYRSLSIQDMRWQYLAPFENEGRVFFRVKLVLQAPETGRLLPFTTLVAVSTPDLPATLSDCPCLFAPCFDPAKPDCTCCIGGR